jgi:hypothetical protein
MPHRPGTTNALERPATGIDAPIATKPRLRQKEALATVVTLHENLHITRAARVGAAIVALTDPDASRIEQRARNLVALEERRPDIEQAGEPD